MQGQIKQPLLQWIESAEYLDPASNQIFLAGSCTRFLDPVLPLQQISLFS